MYANFRNIIAQVPTHLIYGAIDDYLYAPIRRNVYLAYEPISRAPEIKTDVVENLVGGVENLGSFSRVEGAGHLV